MSILIIQLAVLIVSVVAHEVAHGWVAYRLGDPTAKVLGRLTANPVKHVDPFGSIVLPALLMITGSPILIGWAKPVPVQPDNFKRPMIDMCWVALAGPISNLLLALLFAVAFSLHQSLFGIQLGSSNWLAYGLLSGVLVNLVLAVFNVFPIPPLDGSRIIMPILPESVRRVYRRMDPYGLIVVALLAYMNVFSWFLRPIVSYAVGALVEI